MFLKTPGLSRSRVEGGPAVARMMLRNFAGHPEGPASICGAGSPRDRSFHPAGLLPGRQSAGRVSRALEVEKLWKYGVK